MRFFLLFSAATALSVLGIIVPSVWFLAPLGLGIFFYFLLYAVADLRGAFLFGLIFGALTSGAGMVWFFDTVPLAWMGVTDPLTQYYMVGTLWSIASLAAGLATALFALAVYSTRNTWFSLLLLIPLFVVEEELRMWFFSLVTWAPESLVGPHFSSILFGYTLAENDVLLQLASFGGVRMLSAVTALIAISIALLLGSHREKGSRQKLLVACIALSSVLSLPFLFPYQMPEATEVRTIALVTTDVPIESLDIPDPVEPFKRIVAEGREPAIIALPEGRGLEEQIPNQNERTAVLQDIFSGRETLIMGSNYSAEQGQKGKAELTYESVNQGVLARHQKIFLMPEGEYSPAITAFFLRLAGSAQVSQYLDRIGRPIAKGTALVTVPYAGLTLGGLLCSDALSPQLVSTLAEQKGAGVVVTLSNNSWFHHSRTLYAKLLQVAKINAVTHRVYYLTASNAAPSFAIAPTGNMLAESAWGESTILYVTVPVPR